MMGVRGIRLVGCLRTTISIWIARGRSEGCADKVVFEVGTCRFVRGIFLWWEELYTVVREDQRDDRDTRRSLHTSKNKQVDRKVVLYSFCALQHIIRHPTRQREANRSESLSPLERQQTTRMKVDHSARVPADTGERSIKMRSFALRTLWLKSLTKNDRHQHLSWLRTLPYRASVRPRVEAPPPHHIAAATISRQHGQ